ncbi:MAG TPA: DNA repair protein RadC [Candidatus Nanoarchaeia archaeon]
MKIKELTKIERPREKLEKYGPEKLSNSELLAILVGSGTKELNAIELSRKILHKFAGNNLSIADVKELKGTFGLGSAKASSIVASFELARRLLKNKQTSLILTPKDVWEELKDIRDNKKEHFIVFFLDTRNQEIKRETIAVGSLNVNLIHPREVFEPAVKHVAAQIIISHNHPSGDVSPSREDETVTKQLINAGQVLGINILDHIIVAGDNYFSFASVKPQLFETS